MKLLAVFGLALAVVAMDNPTSDDQDLSMCYLQSLLERFKANLRDPDCCSEVFFGLALGVATTGKPTSGDQDLPMCYPQSLLERFKASPRDPDCCSEVLSMVDEGKVDLARNQEVIFPLVRHCLETGKVFPVEKPLEMRMVHVAAFIFMFRIRGEEEMAKDLYDAVMEEHFSTEFKAGLHKERYTQYYLQNFEKLTEDDDKKFYMLWTVQKYGKKPECKGSSKITWFVNLKLAALVLVSMEIPPELLIVGIILYPKSTPEGFTLNELPNFWLMFLSMTKDWYLRLEESEKAELLAFLEKYLRFHWRGHDLLKENLFGEELRQFEKVFASEGQYGWEHLELCTIEKFTVYFYNATQIGCPAFLLKRMLDFYLEESSKEREVLNVYSKNPPFSNQKILGKRLCFLKALERARYMVGKWVRPDKVFLYSQIGCTIKECKEKISGFCEKNPEVMEKWEKVSSASEHWAAFKMKPEEACADLLKLFG